MNLFLLLALCVSFALPAAWLVGKLIGRVIAEVEWRAGQVEHPGLIKNVTGDVPLSLLRPDSFFSRPRFSWWPFVFHWFFVSVTVYFVFGLIPGVVAAGFSESYALSEIRSASGSILNFAFSLAATEGLAAAFAEGVGTNPKKNWDLMVKAMTTAGIDRSELGWIFCYCQFSANPAVWQRIARHLVASGKITQASLVMFEKFVAICHWHQGAIMTETRIAPQKILGSNPTLAAYTWLFVSPDRTYADLIKRRWAIALDVTPEVKAACLAEQEKFVKDVLKKSWSDKIPAIVGSAKFPFPDKQTGAKASASMQDHQPGNKGSAEVTAWITHMTSKDTTGRV